MLIVMGLLATIGSLGLFMSMESLRGGSFRNDRDMAVSALQRARSLAVNNMCAGTVTSDASLCLQPNYCCDGKPHGVHFYSRADSNKGKIVIFQGASFSGRDMAADETIEFENKTVYADAAASVDIVFERLNGNASSTTVTIKDGVGRSSDIDVNSEGRIDWTN
jgi:Tfp pilus assembly protein FimT